MHNSSDTVQGCHGSFQSPSRVCIFPRQLVDSRLLLASPYQAATPVSPLENLELRQRSRSFQCQGLSKYDSHTFISQHTTTTIPHRWMKLVQYTREKNPKQRNQGKIMKRIQIAAAEPLKKEAKETTKYKNKTWNQVDYFMDFASPVKKSSCSTTIIIIMRIQRPKRKKLLEKMVLSLEMVLLELPKEKKRLGFVSKSRKSIVAAKLEDEEKKYIGSTIVEPLPPPLLLLLPMTTSAACQSTQQRSFSAARPEERKRRQDPKLLTRRQNSMQQLRRSGGGGFQLLQMRVQCQRRRQQQHSSSYGSSCYPTRAPAPLCSIVKEAVVVAFTGVSCSSQLELGPARIAASNYEAQLAAAVLQHYDYYFYTVELDSSRSKASSCFSSSAMGTQTASATMTTQTTLNKRPVEVLDRQPSSPPQLRTDGPHQPPFGLKPLLLHFFQFHSPLGSSLHYITLQDSRPDDVLPENERKYE